ncbi:MAG: AAA family ATPase [Candidatus Pacebacteria bacterium]|nr:AAA family ATPase [Candidatus Paceibacterota bacterium]
MRIDQIEIENYKGFEGKHLFKFKGNLVFLVGENNTGKTSVIEAFDFLKSGLPEKRTLEEIKNKNSLDHLKVVVKLKNEIKNVIVDFSEKKYESYVFDEGDGIETIILQRSSESKTIIQNGKNVSLDIKKITIWNDTTKQFENPAGIDTAIRTLFETQFIWSDTNSDNVVDFGPTRICGKLLGSVFSDFQSTQKWKTFQDLHRDTFTGSDSFGSKAKDIEIKIKDVFKKQYGDIDLEFDFSFPNPTSFFKSAGILVDDGIKTKLEDKGSGMQRSMAIAILQVYAQIITTHPLDPLKIKPLFFFIDEPEISLHPKAQAQLLDALMEISKSQQVFITTHSPFLLKQYNSSSHDLFVFNKDHKQKIMVSTSVSFNLFSKPSWGEIVYKAFGIPTEDFHNELYGKLQEKEGRPFIESTDKTKSIEEFFVNNGYNRIKSWTLSNGKSYKQTLMSSIRNKIHHPEELNIPSYNMKELKESIDNMIGLL